MPTPSEEETPRCITCKEVIPIGATVCSKCKGYQTRWKNYLQYAASVVGIFTVVSALAVYIISKAPDLKKILFWSDNIQVISFTYPGSITVLNTGDGKIFISHLTFSIEKGSSGTLLINKILDINEISTHQFDQEEQNRIKNYRVISRLTPQEWNQKVEQSKSPTDSNPCIVYTVIHEQDPLYIQFKNYYGEGFQTTGAKASIHFHSFHTRKILQESLPVRSILLQNPDDKCVS